MVSLTSLNNMISYMSNFQKTNSLQDIVSTDFNSRQFQKLAQKLQEQSLPQSSGSRFDAFNLKNSAAELSVSNKNAEINAKTVESGDKSVTGTASNGASVKGYDIEVEQLAAAQKNKTSDLASDEESSLEQGSYTFKVSSGGKDTNVTFSIKEGDTNKESLDKIAKAINSADRGVTAKVVNDDKNKTSRLEIISNETGTKQRFEIEDLTGNSAEKLGLSNESVSAQDAKYSIDGQKYTGQKNEALLDNGKVKLSFNSVTSKEVRVDVKDDNKAIEQSIKKFVEDYNKVIDDINSANGTESSEKYAKELKSAANSQRGTLAGIGIRVESDGKLSVDSTKLEKELSESPSQVKKVLGGTDGVASKVAKAADRAYRGIYDLNKSTSISNDFSSYHKNGTKTLYKLNLSRGMFIDTNL